MEVLVWPVVVVFSIAVGVFAGPTIRIFAKQLDAEVTAKYEAEKAALLADKQKAEAELAAYVSRSSGLIADLKGDVLTAEAKLKAFELLFAPSALAAASTVAPSAPLPPPLPVAV